MKNEKKHFEFSKIVIGLLVSTYFIVLALGIGITIALVISNPESSVNALVGLFSYVGAVNGISIPFYLNTKCKENIHKYPDIQTIEQYQAINNIGSGMGGDMDNTQSDTKEG